MFRSGRDAGAYQNRGGSASRQYTLPYDLHHSGCHCWLVRQCNSISTELLISIIVVAKSFVSVTNKDLSVMQGGRIGFQPVY